MEIFRRYINTWYGYLVIGSLLSYVYIDTLFNYEEIIEFQRAHQPITRGGWYYSLFSLLDTFIGEMATTIIMGAITSIPFVVAGCKLRKVIKKRNEQKCSAEC